MVCEVSGASTVKLCETLVAAAYSELPASLAVMEQVPVATRVTKDPETVQTDVVVEAKLTVSPDVAVALTVIGGTPRFWLLSAPKVMVFDNGEPPV